MELTIVVRVFLFISIFVSSASAFAGDEQSQLCREALAKMAAAKGLKEVVQVYNETKDKLIEKEKMALIEAIAGRAADRSANTPEDDDALVNFAESIRKEANEQVVKDGLDGLLMGGKNRYSSAIQRVQRHHLIHESPFGFEFLMVSALNQAAAHQALKSGAEIYKSKVKAFTDHRGGDAGLREQYGQGLSDLVSLISKVAKDPEYQRIVQLSDPIYRELLGDRYVQLAHHPMLLSYIHARWIEPNADIVEKTGRILSQKGGHAQIEVEDLDRLLTPKMTDEMKKRVKGLVEETQYQGRVNAQALDIPRLIANYRLKESAMSRVTNALQRLMRPELYKLHTHTREAQIALSYFLMGKDKEAKEQIDSIQVIKVGEQVFPMPENLKKELGAAIAGASKDRELRRAYAALGGPIENAFLHYFGSTDTEIIQNGYTANIFNFRPQQIESARIALQYSFTQNDQKPSMLEIGYGNPSTLSALQTKFRNAVGVDVTPVPQGKKGELDHLKLFQGNIPGDKEVAQKISEQGPYNLILGTDVFKATQGFGAQFRPGVSNTEYLNWVYANLKEGGVFVMVNDYKTDTVFTLNEAREAGFDVVRWKSVYSLDEYEKSLLPGSSPDKGELYAYVLRKGKISMENMVAKVRDSKTGEVRTETLEAGSDKFEKATEEETLKLFLEKFEALKTLPFDAHESSFPALGESMQLASILGKSVKPYRNVVMTLEKVELDRELPFRLRAAALAAKRKVLRLEDVDLGFSKESNRLFPVPGNIPRGETAPSELINRQMAEDRSRTLALFSKIYIDSQFKDRDAELFLLEDLQSFAHSGIPVVPSDLAIRKQISEDSRFPKDLRSLAKKSLEEAPK